MQKLLILDIDETLLHATEQPLDREHDFMLAHYFVYLRPHVHDFMAFCREHFKVAIWTAGNQLYAQRTVQAVCGEAYPLEFVWSRKRCTPTFDPENFKHIYLKNLNKVKRRGFRLEQVIMIDNTPQKLAKNYGNLVQVNDFRGCPDDQELPLLQRYLLHLKMKPMCVPSKKGVGRKIG
ncbi:HAD family hydrolase [Marinicella meishanensis]|uniref:HAD family hydrolase n=1 Tax=Marinicella meishanensis TaxID=2873263 RepID=UPI001CBDDCFD|nr:HAD family hydrolase [Marinicella sp. NBU2979]